MKKLLLSLLFIASFFGAIAQKSDATLTTDAQTNIQTGVYNPAKAYTMFKELIDNKVNQMVTVNGHALTGNITLTASDVGAIGLSSLSGVAPIGYNTGTGAISIATANTSTTGALTNTDWNTFNGKQAALVSGTNIKTVGGTSLLGSGDISVGTGTVTSVTSADGNITVATGTTTPVLTSVSSPKLQTTRSISATGDITWTVNFDGSGNATGSATVTKLNGTSLAGLSTGILKITTGTGVPSTAIAADFPTLNQNTTGSAATLTTPRAINGVNFDGSSAITVTAAAGTLTGTTINSTVVTSSLNAVGTIGTGTWQGSVIGSSYGGIGIGIIGSAGQALRVNAGATAMEYYTRTTNPLTTTGDLLVASSGGAPARLGIGTTNQILIVSAGTPAWTTGTPGTSTNDNASTGYVGEYVSSLIASGSAVSLTTATAANVTSISLTAGDWDVEGNINFTETTATVSARSGGISSTSGTLPTDGSEAYNGVQSTVTTEINTITLPRKRVSLTTTTTIYLPVKATFSAGTCSVFGGITARRVR